MSRSDRSVVAAGIDVGTSAVKAVIFRVGFAGDEGAAARPPGGDAALLAKVTGRLRRRDPKAAVEQAMETALAAAEIDLGAVDYLASTGEGHLVEHRSGHFYGMTTHARGAAWLCPGVRGALDMGALHARAIRMDERAKVLGYAMTSQCASGSGQFVENIARYLGVTLSELGELSLKATAPEKVSGICAVLAETDVINMVSRGVKTADILKGIHLSMADRLVKLLRSAKIDGTVALTGGLAADVGLVSALGQQLAADKRLPVKLVSHPDAIYAGAIGAALWGAVRYRMLEAARRREPGGDDVSKDDLGQGLLSTDDVLVRTLEERDLEAIVRIDASVTGRRRREYYRDKVRQSLTDSRLRTSLVAELDGAVVGFLMASTYYGEFGQPEPTVVIDSLGVHEDFHHRHVGAALMRQFTMNARALGVSRLRTEVGWNEVDYIRFFDRHGFQHRGRLVLESDIA